MTPPIRPTCGHSSMAEWIRMAVRAIPPGGSTTLSLADSGCPSLRQFRTAIMDAANEIVQRGWIYTRTMACGVKVFRRTERKEPRNPR